MYHSRPNILLEIVKDDIKSSKFKRSSTFDQNFNKSSSINGSDFKKYP
jgi:hypothetical protein